MTARTLTRPTLNRLPRAVLLLSALTLAVAASFTPPAWAQGMGPMHGGPGGMHGDGPGMHGMLRLLDRVNATADQRSQIKTIMQAARTDLKANHDAGRALHQQMQTAFAQPTVDANAIEALRLQLQANHEVASKRMTLAMVDASRVLTPDQRKTLADLMAKHQALAQRHAAERAALDKPAGK